LVEGKLAPGVPLCQEAK